MNTYFVYQHTNKINDKKYIGITSQKSVKRRWSHGGGYKNNPHFYSAIEKYGWDNFEHEVLASGLTEEEACKMEKELIKKYNTTNRTKGYNILEGGNTGNGGWHHTDEAKAKISEASKVGGFKGHHHTEESKAKMAEANRGNTYNRKAVKCVETGIVYPAYILAAQAVGLKGAGSITNALRTGGKAGGYHWEKVENVVSKSDNQ